MAGTKSHTLLWIGLLGIAGIVAYEMFANVKPWTSTANAVPVAAISAWINQVGGSSGNNWLNYFTTQGTQADINNMYALISQYWGQNITPPGDLTAYFSNLNTQLNG